MGSSYYESALLRLRRVTAYLTLRYGDVTKRQNLTPVQFEILLFIESQGACSVSAVADFMFVDKSTSSRVLRGIEDKGLIQMNFDQDDRRKRLVSLSSMGQDVVTARRTDWFDVEKDIRGEYDDAIEHLERR